MKAYTKPFLKIVRAAWSGPNLLEFPPPESPLRLKRNAQGLYYWDMVRDGILYWWTVEII